MDEHEREFIEFEARQIDAQDRYFNARPNLLRTGAAERFFEAGFRMAWNTRKGEDNG